MKVSKAKAAEHRAALLAAAAALLKEEGFDGAGVAEISQRAGLTQGAFYRHFESKAALALEAYRKSHADGLAAWRAVCGDAPGDVAAYLDAYLSEAHCRDVAAGCPMAAYGAEVRRQDDALQAAFAAGFEDAVQVLQDALSHRLSATAARRRGLLMVSSLVGSVAMARAVAGSDPDLASEILQSARQELRQLAVSRNEADADHRTMPADADS